MASHWNCATCATTPCTPSRSRKRISSRYWDDDAVTLDIRAPQGAYRTRTRYLVGADGGHSTVRKQTGIAFPGTTDDSFASRAGHVIIPDALLDPATGELNLPELDLHLSPYAHNRLPNGVLSFAMMQPGSGLVDLTGHSASAEAVDGWRDRVDVITARAADRHLSASAVLVRPDGYLAGATDDTPGEPMLHDMHKALASWFGAAA
ncbi:FAD-dependent monooxygenase [Streptomyces sp. NPDC056002]|uniref:aromatic-ring hydroxylase C-terminal domain-containing protein n=1 Tax=Streptomyces sp. NPDC056002 TaxID=3345675 RepID=UPI0035D82723